MFTEQIQQLQGLRGQLPDNAIDTLVSVLGQCANALTHRGPVTIEVPPDRFRAAPCHQITEGDTAAALTAKAYGGSYTRDEDMQGEGEICGPLAAYFEGVVYSRPNEDGFSYVGKCADLECVYADNINANNIYVDYIDAVEIDVDILNVIDLRAPTVRWAVVIECWYYGGTIPSMGGGNAWTTVRECNDGDGSSPHGDPFDVWLPVGRGQDPNVIEGQVIPIKKSYLGGWVSEGQGDDAIGTVKWVADAVVSLGGLSRNQIMAGWRIVRPGGTNYVGRGGSTWNIDVTEENLVFIAAAYLSTDVFDTGGDMYHDHDPHEEGIEDHELGVYTSYSATGVSITGAYTSHDPSLTAINDHSDHTHTVPAPATTDVQGGGGATPAVAQILTTGYVNAFDMYTLGHEIIETPHGHDVYAEIDDPTHRHYVAATLDHTVYMTHSFEPHIPPYVRLWMVERIDNGCLGAAFGGGGPF